MNNRDIQHLLKQEDYCLKRDAEMLEWIEEQAALGCMVTINGIIDSNDYTYKLRVRVYGEEES